MGLLKIFNVNICRCAQQRAFPILARNVLVGGHEALNLLLGELDLLHLLRSGRAVIKQSESQKCREQQTQKTPTPGHRVPVSNERHGMASISTHRLQSHSAYSLCKTRRTVDAAEGGRSRPRGGI